MDTIMRVEGYDFAFDQKACYTCAGNCCIGESGYIWVNQAEQDAIAVHLRITKEEFINAFLLKIRYRFTIKEVPYEGGHSCVFFNREKKMCTIYDVRPKQCRTFPFWEHFKENINEVAQECPGIIRF